MEQPKGVGITELDQRIIRQVEYYFGDYNFPRDKFLQEQIKLDDGWIPLSTMLNFKRLAALTTDEDRIIDALKKSPVKLMEVDEEKKRIRRSLDKPVPEITESRNKEVQARTVYCKGFTKENATLDKLLEFFGQFGSLENVQMRSYLDKATKEYIFKGSVFVVFSSKDEAEEFLKKESVEYEGVTLIIKRQEDYFIGKKKERDERKKMQKAKVQQATNRQQQSAAQKSQDEECKDSDDEEEEEEKCSGFAKGALVHVKGVPDNATWEDIKSAVVSVWRDGAKEDESTDITIAYVDYHRGEEEGWIRLAEADTAVPLLKRAKVVAEKNSKVKAEEKEDKDESSGEDGETKTDEVNGMEKDENKASEKVGESGDDGNEGTGSGGNEEGSDDKEGKDSEEQDESVVAQIEVCGTLVSMRALRGSEEDCYLEKARGAREKKFQSLGKNRKRGGGHGGNRRGRGGRGGKRKHNWDSGPSHKRRR